MSTKYKSLYKITIILSIPLEISRKSFHFKKILIILFLTGSIIGLVLPSFSFAQKGQPLKMPENPAELKEIGKKFLDFFPMTLKKVWEEAVKIWKTMWGWVKNLWNNYIFSWLKSIWQKIFDFFLTSIWGRFKELVF